MIAERIRQVSPVVDFKATELPSPKPKSVSTLLAGLSGAFGAAIAGWYLLPKPEPETSVETNNPFADFFFADLLIETPDWKLHKLKSGGFYYTAENTYFAGEVVLDDSLGTWVAKRTCLTLESGYYRLSTWSFCTCDDCYFHNKDNFFHDNPKEQFSHQVEYAMNTIANRILHTCKLQAEDVIC